MVYESDDEPQSRIINVGFDQDMDKSQEYLLAKKGRNHRLSILAQKRNKATSSYDIDSLPSDSILDDMESLSESDDESDDHGDISFYHNLDQISSLKEANKNSTETMKNQLKDFQVLTKSRLTDPKYMSLSTWFERLDSSQFPKLCRFLKNLQYDFKPDVYDGEQSSVFERAGQVPLYVEKDFLKVFFNYIENHSDFKMNYEESYDSLRMQEFLSSLGDHGRFRFPTFLQGFIDKVKALISRDLDGGVARKGTALEVDHKLAENIMDGIRYGNIQVQGLPSDIQDTSAELFEAYGEYRDHSTKMNASSNRSITEKDREYAINQLLDQGAEIELIMCHVCQSFPRLVRHQVVLTNEGEDEQVLFCGTDCANIIERVAHVANIWKMIKQNGYSLCEIPPVIHKAHRKSVSLEHLEQLKMLIHVLYSTCVDKVPDANRCKHLRYMSHS